MKTAKLLLFVFSFILFTTLTSAQITSAGSGNWSEGATWVGGVVPMATDNVILSHTVTVDVNNAVCNDLTVAGGGRLYFALVNDLGIIVNGNVLVNSDGRIQAASGNPPSGQFFQTIEIKKNLTVDSGGRFDMRQSSGSNLAVGRVVFSGSENSSINLALDVYTSSTEEFNSVIINKSGGAKVILASGTLFQNNNSSNGADTLLLSSGVIETGDKIWVHLATNSAGIQGASQASYINGKLGRGISNSGGNADRDFPIGDASTYRPINVRLASPSNSTGHYVWVELKTGNANTGSSTFTGEIDKVAEDRYYELGYFGGTGAAAMPFYGISPAYNHDDGVMAGNTDLRVAYSTDSRATWINAGPADHTTDLTTPPTTIASDSLNPAITVNTGTSIHAALARVSGTTTNPLPVELTSFSAVVAEKKVILSWTTETEVNNAGFEIERSVDNQAFSKVGFVPGAGTTTEKLSYSFFDENLLSQKYYYRLKQVDFDGTFEYSSVVEADINAPTEFNLLQNYPNPFNPTTTINFSLAKEEKVKITVVNAIGQNIEILVDEFKEAGSHQVNFNASGLQSGVYFYKIQAGDFSQTRKMLLIK